VSEAVVEEPIFGPMSGNGIIGDVTEALHKFLLDGYDLGERPPRFEEDLNFIPKDREEVLYIYMYRVATNPNMRRQKRYQQAPVFLNKSPEDGGRVFYHRPPLLLDLFYLVMVHSKFRSDAERLLGWTLLRLNEATHIIYRPRRFLLPDGDAVDSLGRSYSLTADIKDEGLHMEKVSLALVDDMTVGDAINMFSLNEAPYRPFLTYRARVAMDGPLVESTGGTTVRIPHLAQRAALVDEEEPVVSGSGRMKTARRTSKSPANQVGPEPHSIQKLTDEDSED